MNLPPVLTAKTFGMPRWAWMALLAGGVAVGLYMRRRSQAQDAMAEAAAPSPDGTDPASPDSLAAQSDPGLAGVGVVGPTGGSVVPVESPQIPPGYPETFDVLGNVISSIAEGLTKPSTTIIQPGKKPPKPRGAPKGKHWVWTGRQWMLVDNPPRPHRGSPPRGGGSGGNHHPASGSSANSPGRPSRRSSPFGPVPSRPRPTGGGPPRRRPRAHAPLTPQRRRVWNARQHRWVLV